MLHFLEMVFHDVQAVDAALKVPGKIGEERRYFGVFEVLELRHNVVTFLAGFHPIDEIFQTVAAQAKIVDALGKHSGEEQSVISDMFADLALTIKRRRTTADYIGLDQHFAHVIEPTIESLANLVDLIGLAKLRQQMRRISEYLRIADADFFRVVPSH